MDAIGRLGDGDGVLGLDDVIASLWELLADRGDDMGDGDGDLESDDVIASL